MLISLSLCSHLSYYWYAMYVYQTEWVRIALIRDMRPWNNSHREHVLGPPFLDHQSYLHWLSPFLGRWAWRLFKNDWWGWTPGLPGRGEEHTRTPGSVLLPLGFREGCSFAMTRPSSGMAEALFGETELPLGELAVQSLPLSPPLCPHCPCFHQTLQLPSLDYDNRPLTWLWFF